MRTSPRRFPLWKSPCRIWTRTASPCAAFCRRNIWPTAAISPAAWRRARPRPWYLKWAIRARTRSHSNSNSFKQIFFRAHHAGTYQVPRLAVDSRPRRALGALLARGYPMEVSTRIEGLFAAVNAVPVLQADLAAESILQPALRECVARAVRSYLSDRDAQMPEGLYDLVLHEVEAPLLYEVLSWSGGNQSKAAAALGINRATLRKKLAARGI